MSFHRLTGLVAAGSILLAGSQACNGTGTGPVEVADLESLLTQYGVPGVSVAVINDFRLDYLAVGGVADNSSGEPVTQTTLFQAASVSKPVSALAVHAMAQEGRIFLDSDVDDYLASWEIPENDLLASEPVTLRRLLSHTAGTTVHGFRGYRLDEPVPTLLQVLNGTPPANSPPIFVDYTPGTDQRYSGGGYVVIQQALMDVEGIPFLEILEERVFEPLGMVNSSFEQPSPDSPLAGASSGHHSSGQVVPGLYHIYPESAAAGLWTTPRDLALFLVDIQRSLKGESGTALDRNIAEQMLSEVAGDYALGFSVWTENGQEYFGHGGANEGFRCLMTAHLTKGYGVVVMTNSDLGTELAEAVVERVGKRERWSGF